MNPDALPGEATLLASWRALARASPGASVTDTPGAVAAVFPEWLPLNNALARTPVGDPAAAALEVGRLAERYEEAGVERWAYWVPSIAIDFGDPDAVVVPGLVRDATTLVMRADLDGALAPNGSARATSVESAAVAGDEPVAVEVLEQPRRDAGLDAWVMVQGAVAVSGLWTCLHDEDCGVYAVGTAPGWRRRGLARALVAHALADARRRGARTASLQSTPAAVSLYRSLGFEAVGRYEEWLVTATDRRDRLGAPTTR